MMFNIGMNNMNKNNIFIINNMIMNILFNMYDFNNINNNNIINLVNPNIINSLEVPKIKCFSFRRRIKTMIVMSGDEVIYLFCQQFY